jgi:hypothetical protein
MLFVLGCWYGGWGGLARGGGGVFGGGFIVPEELWVHMHEWFYLDTSGWD